MKCNTEIRSCQWNTYKQHNVHAKILAKE